MSINILRDYYLEELQKRSANGVHIPEDLLREIDKLTQQVKEFLQESQEEFDLKERNKSMEQMRLLLLMTFFNNVLQKIDDNYRDNFKLYNTYLFNGKDYGKTVVATDIREKIHAIHKMLIESWHHMVPPRIEDIHFPDSRLENNMIYESPGEYGIKPIVAEYGFLKPPSLKPDAQLLSIEEYLTTEYKIVDKYFENTKVANFAIDPDSVCCNPSDYDPTFLRDFSEEYDSIRYLDVYQKYKGLLSDYHQANWQILQF
jgi:hypothetical protein